MRYIQPYTSTDIDASYVNGNPAIGLNGSIPSAEMVEHTQREITNFIDNSIFSQDTSDLAQILQTARSQRVNYCVDIGTANELHVICVPAVTTLVAGFPLRVLVAFDNTSEATIRVNGLGPIYILRANGANLDADDLKAGEVVELVYDGNYFQVSNYLGYSATVENNYFYNFNIPYVEDTGSANALIAIFDPVISALPAGLAIEVKAIATNTGPCTIVVNAQSAKAIKSSSLQSLIAGQIVAGQVVLLVYDGLQFQLMNPAIVSQVSLTGVQVAKTDFYQDANYHVFPQFTGWAEAYRHSYVPVAANNKVHIKIRGTASGDIDLGPTYGGFEFGLRCSYTTDGGQTWIGGSLMPPLGTGGTFIAGGFLSNMPYYQCKFRTAGSISVIREDSMFDIVGELEVPAGPPSAIIFRLEIWTDRAAKIRGGSTMHITEFVEP